ncbi:hypothetical protein [Facklamia miroungae]|uniref:Uncharacterized protein n=1 Tax=Facklamia miroungae TaxID=120956 RepID=A0A1G7QP97_9LACT|nr:hypothetical protein [Facklamia miroungae]NKZ29016.1 hypothetical protein [Facklamia miroungae]SDG00304.1 hypothetical protein SAMN05421791_102165 [Facklamia miroungae]
MFKWDNLLSAICSGFIFAILAGGLMSYWVWLEMRVHTWVLCWLVFALFIVLSMLFKIKPITYFIGLISVVVLMIAKSPNIFFYNVRDMFFLDMKFGQIKIITLSIMLMMTVVMIYLWYRERKLNKF